MASIPTILTVSFLFSLLYFVRGSVVTKPLIIWFLSAVCLRQGDTRSNWIGLGLLCSSLGDIFLEIDSNNFSYFVGGLLSFLIAHVMYINAFVTDKLCYDRLYYVSLFVLTYMVTIMILLLPGVETGLIVPVIVYGVVISGMLFLGVLRFFSTSTINTSSRVCGLIGSIVFVISDSILAFNKFRTPFENAHTYVMITYYAGQAFIAASTVRPEMQPQDKSD